jgi:phosphoglycerate dehydrogenase-like enzyme
MNSVICLDEWCQNRVYPKRQIDRIASLTNLLAPPLTSAELRNRPDLLAEVNVIFSGWGGMVLNEALFRSSPNLSLYLYAAGSPDSILDPGLDSPDVTVSCSVHQNSMAVAEYCLGFFLIGLKRAIPIAQRVRTEKSYEIGDESWDSAGNYRSSIGILSMGRTAQELVKLLKPFNHQIRVFDPYVPDERIAEVGADSCGSLEELFASCDLISIHTPLKEETRGLVSGSLIRGMKRNATFINTSRGAVLDEASVLRALSERSDVFAVLDVADPEPPDPDSPLYCLPNVLLTPHIAGVTNQECERLSDAMIDELERFMRGEHLKFAVHVASANSD